MSDREKSVAQMLLQNTRKKCPSCYWIGTTERYFCPACDNQLEAAAGGPLRDLKRKVLLVRNARGEVIVDNLDSYPSKGI